MFPRPILAFLVVGACQPTPAECVRAVEPVPLNVLNIHVPDRPYSEVVQAGNTFYFSGKIAVTDDIRAMSEGRIEAETRAVMESFRELLDQVGLGFGDIVKATVFLQNIADYDGMNSVYREYFSKNPPARETVAVRGLVAGAAVEISFIAVRR